MTLLKRQQKKELKALRKQVAKEIAREEARPILFAMFPDLPWGCIWA